MMLNNSVAEGSAWSCTTRRSQAAGNIDFIVGPLQQGDEAYQYLVWLGGVNYHWGMRAEIVAFGHFTQIYELCLQLIQRDP